MKAHEWTTKDKTTWGDGPWVCEPDKRQWIDAVTEMSCLMVRGPSGAWCGYVGVPEGHPLHGKCYDDIDIEVHGGLTFAGHCADMSVVCWQKNCDQADRHRREAKQYPHGDSAEWLKEWLPVLGDYDLWKAHKVETAICHVPAIGEPDHLYWFGFDTSHAGDVCPKYAAKYPSGFADGYETYKDAAYVETQVASLAKQIAGLV